ncbi:hypothetical protein BJ508DRAFT_412239 [Ascobolus immersus RN42]|uniref:F-box domain-containing protein n=1 Tax=Ascobolus immersus RN42 TaxID=1160509 RepID=A0A3N4ILU3_ASCIM|nr:hypothetical protein BJ508DRAFT_412239 [Ascobolus immersus RN42]
MSPITAALESNDLVLEILRSAPSFKIFSSLSQVCKRFQHVAKANEASILGDIAARVLPKEALDLFDKQRPSTMSFFELARYRQHVGDHKRESWDVRHKADPRKGWLSKVEIGFILEDEKFVDSLLARVVNAMKDVATTSTKVEIRRALYTFLMLISQFRFVGIHEFVPRDDDDDDIVLRFAWKVSREQFLKELRPYSEDNGLGLFKWVYDYTYAASLDTRLIFDVLGLEKHLVECAWWFKPVEMLRAPNPLGQVSDLVDNSLKRFWLVNMFDSSKVEFRKSYDRDAPDSVEEMFPFACNKTWRRAKQETRDKYLDELEKLRRGGESGFNDNYNPRLFRKLSFPVYAGAGKYERRDILTIGKNGWKALSRAEKGLIEEFETDDWLAGFTVSDAEAMLDSDGY